MSILSTHLNDTQNGIPHRQMKDKGINDIYGIEQNFFELNIYGGDFIFVLCFIMTYVCPSVQVDVGLNLTQAIQSCLDEISKWRSVVPVSILCK